MIEYKVKVHTNGTKEWYLNGKRHREDGPAIEYTVSGNKQWHLHGELHREDGPAIEYTDGEKHWYLNGERHREDGPASEYPSGDKSWYLNGKQLTEDEFNQRMNPPTKEMTIKELEKELGYSIKIVK